MLKNWLISGLGLVRRKYKRVTLSVAAVMVVFSFGLSITAAPAVNAQNPGSSFGSSVSTCAIETVGWVICPVMRTIAKLADFGFAFINKDFLRIEYDVISGSDSGIFKAWELIRNIANIVLVLVFLYIVYTQITGRNTGDFNLKRILPRLVIGAVLLNLSYYICALAIQGSNIVGSGVLTAMVDVAEQIGSPAMNLNNAANGFEDAILTQLVAKMLEKDGTVWVMLAPMAAITIGIATVSAVALILLIARKVVVSMLVLVSPLLFVAYLLPNLERYFQQWVRLFIQLIMLYPIVAFLLGTGQIVSATIISVGSGGESDYSVEGDGYQAKNGGSGSATTDLAAAGAAVLPLVGVWWMMKGLSAVMSSAGTRLTAGIGRGRSKEQAEKLQAKFGKPSVPTSAGNVNVMGGRVNVYDRKPAFSRVPGRRHRASAGGSSLPLREKPQPPRSPQQNPQPQNPLAGALNGMLGGQQPDKSAQTVAEASKKMDDFNNTNISADNATAASVQAMVAEAGDKKKKNANELFSNLNKRDKPQSPDAQRSFGTAQPAAGGGGQAGGPSVSSHSNDYRAPTIAHAPTIAPQQSTATSQRIVAVPVQVDPSTLLNQSHPEQARATSHHEVPTTELQQRAKGVAQKYLFDSARDIDESAAKLDDLTKKRDDDNASTKDQ